MGVASSVLLRGDGCDMLVHHESGQLHRPGWRCEGPSGPGEASGGSPVMSWLSFLSWARLDPPSTCSRGTCLPACCSVFILVLSAVTTVLEGCCLATVSKGEAGLIFTKCQKFEHPMC